MTLSPSLRRRYALSLICSWSRHLRRRWQGLDQISKYLQTKFSSVKEGEDAPRDELEATLRLLIKATDFMVSERNDKFERAIEKVMKGWEGKVAVLSALLSILEQYGWTEDRLVLDCYKMIKRMCSYATDTHQALELINTYHFSHPL